MELVELETPSAEDYDFVFNKINQHSRYTESSVAYNLLENWENEKSKFIKVIPTEYKQILEKQKLAKEKVA